MPFGMWNKALSWFLCLAIRMQLLLLLLLMMVPSMGIVINSALNKRAEQVTASRTSLWELADLIADKQQDIVFSAQQTGSMLAKTLSGKGHDASRLQQILIDIAKINTSFSGIAVTDRDGTIIASYPGNDKLHSIAKRRSFREAKASGLFSSGEYTVEKTSPTTFFSFAYPMLSAKGDFNGVIEIEISQKFFLNILKETHFSPMSNFSIMDHQGVILYSHKHPHIIGLRDRKDNFAIMQRGSDSGDFFTGLGNDGLSRLSYFRKFHLEHESAPYLFIRASKPTDSIGDEANREFLVYILTLGAFSLAAFFLAGIIGKRSIADRVKEMETIAIRLADGDLSARVASGIAGGELGRLAVAIDQMATQLEDKDKRHETMLDEIRFKESKFGSLYRLSQMASEAEDLIKNFALDEGTRSTGSAIGYIYFLNDDETTLTLHAWSKGVMEACHVIDKETVYNVACTGLWGEAIRQRKPIITNDYAAPHPSKKGCPEGHVPIKRHMNIPLIIDGKIVLLAGVGNKECDYTENDIRMLTLIMDSMWKLLDKKRYLEERLKNERFLTTLINANLEATYLLKTDGTVVIANEVFTNKVGETLNEVVGKNVFDLFRMDVASYRKQQFDIAATTGKPWSFEDTRDGLDFLHSVNPVIDQQGNVSHIAVHSMDITTLKAFDNELIATNLKLQALNQKIEETREEERRTLSRELHDQMGQTLTGLSLDLDWLAAQLDMATNQKLNNHLLGMHITVETTIAMVQNITARLSPPLLDNLGLSPAISYYVKDFERKSGIVCHLMLDEGADNCISKEESMSVFRILQESLTNVARHADATEVAVSLCLTPQTVVMEVADNGKGATGKNISAPTAFGVLGMQERARKCAGKLVFQENPGGGTIVRLEIPLRKGEIVDENISS
jgi:PAS domain S-box-containing protein